MISLFALLFGCLGVLSLLQGGQSDATGYGEGAAYDRPSSGIPSYHDDEHIRQCRRREREKARRAAESGSVCLQYPPLHSHIPYGIL